MSDRITIKIDKAKEARRRSRAEGFRHGRGGFHRNKRRERMMEKLLDESPLSEESGDILIGTSDIVTAFDKLVVGSKVTEPAMFWRELSRAVRAHDFSKDRVPGQGLVTLANSAGYLSSGVGKRTQDPSDYVIRLYRGQVRLYLKRKFAAPVDSAKAVVYTTEAYCRDPDVSEEEKEEILKAGYTHMLVAVLAASGSPSPLSPYRFVHNLAGGNREAGEWTADEIRAKAREIMDYWSSETGEGWCGVAD